MKTSQYYSEPHADFYVATHEELTTSGDAEKGVTNAA